MSADALRSPQKLMSIDLLDMLTAVADAWREENPRSKRNRKGNRAPRPQLRRRHRA